MKSGLIAIFLVISVLKEFNVVDGKPGFSNLNLEKKWIDYAEKLQSATNLTDELNRKLFSAECTIKEIQSRLNAAHVQIKYQDVKNNLQSELVMYNGQQECSHKVDDLNNRLKIAEENLKSKEDLLRLKDQQILDEKDKVKIITATIQNLQSYLANAKDKINVLNREIIIKTEQVKSKNDHLTLKENEIRSLNEKILAKDDQIDGLKDLFKTVSEKLVERTNQFEKCKVVAPFEAPWDSDGWNIIQRREDGSVNFNRSWLDYKNGFGYLQGEFFIGLEKLHQMTKDKPHELFIKLGNRNGETASAHYDNFQIGSELEFYKLKRLGRYSGSANSGDGLRNQEGRPFSTFDRDNGSWGGFNCMDSYSGGWWYSACDRSLPNGKYNYDVEWPSFGPCDIVEMRIKAIYL